MDRSLIDRFYEEISSDEGYKLACILACILIPKLILKIDELEKENIRLYRNLKTEVGLDTTL